MKKHLALLLLLSAILIAGCTKSPAKTLEEFEDIIAEKNAEGLYELVTLEENVYWTEKEAEDVINYFTENNSAYEEQLSLLHEQKDALKQKNGPVNKTGLFYFDEEKKFYARAYEVSLDKASFVKFEELVVSVLEDKEVSKEGGSDEHIIVGLFGPGHYYLKGHADYGYVILEDNADFALLDDKRFNEEIELDLKGEAATVLSTQPETTLYIDDKKIEQDIGAETGAIIQPLLSGLVLRAENEFAWGKLVSEEVEYVGKEEMDLTPHIFVNEEEREEIARIITDFNEKLLTGVTENDQSYLNDTIATDEAKSGYDSIFEQVASFEKGEVITTGYLPGVVIDISGHYEGGLIESIIDFAHAENLKDEETNENLLVLKANLDTNLVFVRKGHDESTVNKNSRNYFEPVIHLKKENDQWIIAKQIIELGSPSSESSLTGEQLVKTKVNMKQ